MQPIREIGTTTESCYLKGKYVALITRHQPSTSKPREGTSSSFAQGLGDLSKKFSMVSENKAIEGGMLESLTQGCIVLHSGQCLSFTNRHIISKAVFLEVAESVLQCPLGALGAKQQFIDDPSRLFGNEIDIDVRDLIERVNHIAKETGHPLWAFINPNRGSDEMGLMLETNPTQALGRIQRPPLAQNSRLRILMQRWQPPGVGHDTTNIVADSVLSELDKDDEVVRFLRSSDGLGEEGLDLLIFNFVGTEARTGKKCDFNRVLPLAADIVHSFNRLIEENPGVFKGVEDFCKLKAFMLGFVTDSFLDPTALNQPPDIKRFVTPLMILKQVVDTYLNESDFVITYSGFCGGVASEDLENAPEAVKNDPAIVIEIFFCESMRLFLDGIVQRLGNDWEDKLYL